MMDNIFSYLGFLGSYDNLTKNTKLMTNIMEAFYDSEKTAVKNEGKVTAEAVADKVIEISRNYNSSFSFHIECKRALDKLEECKEHREGYAMSETIKAFNMFFNAHVLPTFEEELRFIMIASYEYTRSLYRIKINNGTLSNPSKYISVFDKKNREIKKLITHSGRKFEETNQKEKLLNCIKDTVSAKLRIPGAITVLPYYIRRMFDKDQGEREILMHSIYDIGPVLGLIGVSTQWRNPYLYDVKNDEDDEDDEKNRKEYSGGASVHSFLNSFTGVPFTLDTVCKDRISANEALQECKERARKEEKERIKKSALEFFETVATEEMCVFGQFMVERFVHGCFLSKAYQCQLCLPYDEYFNHYLDKIIEKLIIMPLPRTRVLIMDCLKAFVCAHRETGKEPFGVQKLSPAEILIVLELVTNELRRLVKHWVEITLPTHILCYHFLCAKNDLDVDSKAYFKSIYDKYQFYEVDQAGNIDISKAMKLEPINSLESQKDGMFSLYAKKIYKFFLEGSYEYAFKYSFSERLGRLIQRRYKIEDPDLENLDLDIKSFSEGELESELGRTIYEWTGKDWIQTVDD